MDYLGRVGCVFGFIMVLDVCWIGFNRTWRMGIYNENHATLSMAATHQVVIASLACWLQTALFLCYEEYDTQGMAFGKGAWIGSLVYGVFNLTSFSLFEGWRKSWRTSLGDTVWGTFLFGMAALVAQSLL
jgi:uncharacterized membrane protein